MKKRFEIYEYKHNIVILKMGGEGVGEEIHFDNDFNVSSSI